MNTPPAAQKPTVVITGASGLIGTRVVEGLHEDFNVVGLDVKPPQAEQPKMAFIETDLTSNEGVKEALEQLAAEHGKQIASVVHLAAYYDFSGEPSPLYEELTIQGTRRLLDSLQELGFVTEQFIFSSSLLVMKPSEDPIDESSPVEAEWAYPQSKLAAEDIIYKHHGSIPAVILRIAGVYDEQGHSLPVTQQIARIHQKQFESYVFPGDTENGQALVHLDDLVDCIQHTINHRAELTGERMYLIAEPDVMSYHELQEQIGELLHGQDWPTIRVPKIVAKAGAYVMETFQGGDEEAFIKPWMIDLADDHYEASISRAQRELGWQPRHRLRDTLPGMVEFLKQDPRGFYKENKLPLPDDLK